jgi:NAD(P)-dependent dehydrogenase (short-subunit alcohol dehydrogenase family)
MNRLVDKVAVITGAGSGIGRASAKMFVAEGAKVVVAELDETLGEASAREAGTGARFMRTDVTDEESVKQMVRQAREAFGRIDVLLNCAGGSLREDSPVTEVDLSIWDHTMNLDLKGPFLCCRHVIPVMVEQGNGSVVNFSSVVALRGNHIAHVYVMAKGGLISFTRGPGWCLFTQGCPRQRHLPRYCADRTGQGSLYRRQPDSLRGHRQCSRAIPVRRRPAGGYRECGLVPRL